MPIKFHCPSCDAAIKAPDTHLGQTLPCPKCGQPVVVAAESASLDVIPPAPELPHPPEPEPVVDVPEIVTREQRRAGATPPAPPSAPGENAFASPQAPAGPARSVDLQEIRIVDLDIPFRSVFKFSAKMFASVVLLTIALYAVFFVLFLLFAFVFGLGVASFGP